MRLLINSYYLHTQLRQIKFFEGEEVQSISLDGDILNLTTHDRTVEIVVHVVNRGEKTKFDHSKCHWADVRKLTNQVSEQPIVLELNEIINVIFQY